MTLLCIFIILFMSIFPNTLYTTERQSYLDLPVILSLASTLTNGVWSNKRQGGDIERVYTMML